MAGIYEALVAVNRGVQAIAKAQKNRQQGYMFRGIDDVMNALHPLFCEHGIVIIRRDKDVRIDEGKSKSGGVLYMITLTTEWVLAAADGTTVSVVAIGQGMDSSDKGLNKAASTSYKYALLQLFSIPTEETAALDADLTTPEAIALATPQQVERIKALAEENGADPVVITDYYHLEKLEELNTRQADLAIKRMERRAREAKQPSEAPKS